MGSSSSSMSPSSGSYSHSASQSQAPGGEWSKSVNQQDGLPPPPYMQSPQDAAAIGRQYQAALFARCARGEHDVSVKFGPCGIITCIFCFPIGLICLFADTHRECARCGVVLD